MKSYDTNIILSAIILQKTTQMYVIYIHVNNLWVVTVKSELFIDYIITGMLDMYDVFVNHFY